jgi:DNA polymerase III epsilon subunit-like protein
MVMGRARLRASRIAWRISQFCILHSAFSILHFSLRIRHGLVLKSRPRSKISNLHSPTFMTREIYFSVDVETSGPIPGEYSLLSIGACVVGDTAQHFYVELAPLNENYMEDALRTSGFSLAELKQHGTAPRAAMAQFAQWVRECAQGAYAVFVGFNAPFDWSFVNYYFVKFGERGKNPFGHSALDIKSYYMGAYGTTFGETGMKRLPNDIHPPHTPLSHNALEDAIQQAEIFQRMLERRRE